MREERTGETGEDEVKRGPWGAGVGRGFGGEKEKEQARCNFRQSLGFSLTCG